MYIYIQSKIIAVDMPKSTPEDVFGKMVGGIGGGRLVEQCSGSGWVVMVR